MNDQWQWQALYLAALVELQPGELRNKIELANAAMRQRRVELMNLRDRNSIAEQRAITDAITNLGVVEKFELKPALTAINETKLA